MDTKTQAFRKAVAHWLETTKGHPRDLAHFSNSSETTITKWLSEETTNITLERALAIAKVIGYEFEV